VKKDSLRCLISTRKELLIGKLDLAIILKNSAVRHLSSNKKGVENWSDILKILSLDKLFSLLDQSLSSNYMILKLFGIREKSLLTLSLTDLSFSRRLTILRLRKPILTSTRVDASTAEADLSRKRLASKSLLSSRKPNSAKPSK
jgi:hypothetical protein